MNNTEKAIELVNKHLRLHGGDDLGISEGDVYRAVIDAVSEALDMPVVLENCGQLNCRCGLPKRKVCTGFICMRTDCDAMLRLNHL